MIRKARIILRFYQTFLPASWLLTACCSLIFQKWGIGTFSIFFWFKLSTMVLIFYLINTVSGKTFYYYYNLGLSKRLLWISSSETSQSSRINSICYKKAKLIS